MEQLRYTIFSTDLAVREQVKGAVTALDPGAELVLEISVPLTAVSPHDLKMLRASEPRLFVLDIGEDPGVGLKALRHLSDESPGRLFLVVGPPLEPEQLLAAMRAGAAEYLPRPMMGEDLSDAISRVLRRGLHVPAAAAEPAKLGRVVACFGAKGGTGVTTTAVNLAVELRRSTGKPVLMLDLDLDLGIAAFLLGLKPRFNIRDVIRNYHRLDEGLLQSYAELHETGLHLLSATPAPELSERIAKEQVDAVLRFLRRHYDYIVVDIARPFSPAALGAFEHADVKLLVTTAELPALHNIKRFLPVLERATGTDPRSGISIVVNAMSSDSMITREDVRKALGLEIAWVLSRDEEAVSHAANTAKPCVMNPRSRWAKEVKAMAAGLCLPEEGKAEARRPLEALLRSFRGSGSRNAPPPKHNGNHASVNGDRPAMIVRAGS